VQNDVEMKHYYSIKSKSSFSPVDLSVIILTFNEEVNLPASLDSVSGWAREVFVVDSYSTDQTVEICLARKEEGIRVVQHEFIDYSQQWNWALQNLPIASSWILKLDADERVTPEFQSEVRELIQTAAVELDGVYFRRRIVFMGGVLRWSGVRSNYDLRLWRTGKAYFESRPVNEHALVEGGTRYLRSFVLHENSKSIADWLDKHNRYSSLEAINIIEKNVTGEIAPRIFGNATERRMFLRKLRLVLPCKALLSFIYLYIICLGFLDGRSGFRYAIFKSAFAYWIHLKVTEYDRTGRKPEIIWPQRGVADPNVHGNDQRGHNPTP